MLIFQNLSLFSDLFMFQIFHFFGYKIFISFFIVSSSLLEFPTYSFFACVFSFKSLHIVIIVVLKSACCRERQVSYDTTYMWSLKKKGGYKRTYLQNRNRVTDVENKHGYRGQGGRDKLGDWD